MGYVIGQKHRLCKVMLIQSSGEKAPGAPGAGRMRARGRAVLMLLGLLAGLFAPVSVLPVSAQSAANPSGLPLPRFASTRSTPINVRVGPGTRYAIAWVYLQAGLPVEIVQEFDTWRKIRDVDGEEGWVHQNLLSGARIGYIAPWDAAAQVPIHSARNPESSVRAFLGAKFRVSVSSCDGTWCAISATHEAEGQRPATYTGFVDQDLLWGVYADEVFN